MVLTLWILIGNLWVYFGNCMKVFCTTTVLVLHGTLKSYSTSGGCGSLVASLF